MGEQPKLRTLPRNWLSLRVDGVEELAQAIHHLVQTEGLIGMHVFGHDVDQLWAWFRERYLLVLAAGGAVSDADGRLLAIHRLGRWDLPKGKLEAGEELQAAAVREVREECGLQRLRLVRELCTTWHTYERHGVQHLKCTYWYLMEGDATEPLTAQTEEDIDAVRWLGPAEVEAMRSETYPSLLPVLNAWGQARDRA